MVLLDVPLEGTAQHPLVIRHVPLHKHVLLKSPLEGLLVIVFLVLVRK